MNKIIIFIARPGSSYKKLPVIELASVPRAGDLLWYRNSITGVSRNLKVTAVEREVIVGDHGTGQKINLYCKTVMGASVSG